jgi:hypothetical protein
MPTLTRYFIKTGLIYLLLALLTNLVLSADGLINLHPAILALRPVYTHLLIVGWVTHGIYLWGIAALEQRASL